MKNKAFETELFYCSHLGDMLEDDMAVRSFTIRHPETASGLLEYLQRGAFSNELSGLMRTYMVREQKTNKCVAYFSLKAGLVSLEEHKVSDNETLFDTLPGVEVAYFALNESYVNGQNGYGATVFEDVIEPVIREVAKNIGLYLIYVYALPEPVLIKNYQDNYGLKRLSPEAEKDLHARLRPRADKNCIFMYKLVREGNK